MVQSVCRHQQSNFCFFSFLKVIKIRLSRIKQLNQVFAFDDTMTDTCQFQSSIDS